MTDKDIYDRYGALMLAIVRQAMTKYYPNDDIPNRRTRSIGAAGRLTKDTILAWEVESRRLMGHQRWAESRMSSYSEKISEIEKEFSDMKQK